MFMRLWLHFHVEYKVTTDPMSGKAVQESSENWPSWGNFQEFRSAGEWSHDLVMFCASTQSLSELRVSCASRVQQLGCQQAVQMSWAKHRRRSLTRRRRPCVQHSRLTPPQAVTQTPRPQRRQQQRSRRLRLPSGKLSLQPAVLLN